MALSSWARASLRYRIARALLMGISNPMRLEMREAAPVGGLQHVGHKPASRAIAGSGPHSEPAKPGHVGGLPRLAERHSVPRP